MNNTNRYDGGIVYVETETKKRPAKGSVCTGWKLNEGRRVKGFITTDEEVSCRVNHVVDTKYLENGFYVIGVRCPPPKQFD